MKITHLLCLSAIIAAVTLPVAAQSPEPEATPAPAAEPQVTETAMAAETPVTPTMAPQEPPAPAPATMPITYYDKLKVEIDGKADSDGVIQLKFLAKGGEAKLINVNVMKKMKDKEIARDIWKELSLAAGDAYKVKLKSKKVEIKKSNKASPVFALTIYGQSVTGVAVNTKH